METLNVCLSLGGKCPQRSNKFAAGYDLYAKTDGHIDSFKRVAVPLGIQTQFSEGWVGLIQDRSGLAAKNGLTHFAGVIDSDYRGEWMAILFNSTDLVYHYKKGDRIAQVVFVRHADIEPTVVESVEDTERGHKGLGSSGN